MPNVPSRPLRRAMEAWKFDFRKNRAFQPGRFPSCSTWLRSFSILLAGYWRLQVTHHEQYLQLSERNRTRDLPIIAPRGRILDRDGRVLVDNLPAFSVLLSRDDPAKLIPEKIDGIARGLGIDPQALEQQVDQSRNLPRFQPIVIKKSATMQDVAFVESHRTEYPELDLIQVQERFYPKHDFAAALLGYVGDVSPERSPEPAGAT